MQNGGNIYFKSFKIFTRKFNFLRRENYSPETFRLAHLEPFKHFTTLWPLIVGLIGEGVVEGISIGTFHTTREGEKGSTRFRGRTLSLNVIHIPSIGVSCN